MLQLLLSLIVVGAVLAASGNAEEMDGPYALAAHGLEGEVLEGALNPSSAVDGGRFKRDSNTCDCPCSSVPCCCQCYIAGSPKACCCGGGGGGMVGQLRGISCSCALPRSPQLPCCRGFSAYSRGSQCRPC